LRTSVPTLERALSTGVPWQLIAQQRTRRLKGHFGSEYDRTVRESKTRREAEAELAEREARRERLEIRLLSSEARSRYLEQWQAVQAQFVDDPAGAVTPLSSSDSSKTGRTTARLLTNSRLGSRTHAKG
jgi:hypothetical protein